MDNLFPRKSSFSVKERILAAAGLLVFGVGSSVVAFFNPSTEKFFPVCPLLTSTGFACSGCGLTRGFHALFHGDVMTAVSYNALIPIYVFMFGYFIIYLSSIVIRGKGLGLRIATPWTLGTFLIVALLFGLVRNIPLFPFTFLYP